MFLFRSLFWLGLLVMLLPPASDGSTPAPRTSFYETALATRALLADLSGMCERNPLACDVSRDAITVVTRKMATGADIVVAGVAAGRDFAAAPQPAAADVPPELGTLTRADLQPGWALAPEPR